MNKYEVEFNEDAPFPQALMRKYRIRKGAGRLMVTPKFLQLIADGEAYEVFYLAYADGQPYHVRGDAEANCRETMRFYEKKGAYCIFDGIEPNAPDAQS